MDFNPSSPGPFLSAYQQAQGEEMKRRQIQALIEEARNKTALEQAKLPSEIASKQASADYMKSLALKSAQEKQFDPLHKAKAASETLQSRIPELLAVAENEEAFKRLIGDVRPELVDVLNTPELRRSYAQNLLQQSKPYYTLEGAKARATATENAAKTGFDAKKYQADTMERIAKIKAASGEGKQNVLTTDKLYAAMVTRDMQEGKLSPEEAAEALLNFRAASVVSKPVSGVGVQVGPGGKLEMGNKPQPKVPAYPTKKPEGQTAATDFDAKWATLKSGEKLVGPDGKTYVKK